MISHKSAASLAALAVFSLCVPNAAAQATSTSSGQAWPAKTVRYIVPMGPGSGADTIGRIVTGGLTQTLGQQFILDNRGGAAGNIGADAGAKAPPDGYTLFQVSSTHAINVSLYKSLPYDLVRDLAPVTHLASSPSAVVVHPSLPVKTIAELVKLAKARPSRELVTTIRNAAVAAMNEPATRKRLLDLGYIIVGDQPEEFAAFMKSEIASFGKIIKQTGMTAE